MKFISHRGNLSGRNTSLENTPSYVDQAMNSGFYVEVDLWFSDGEYFLGHDAPEHKISAGWLNSRKEHLYVHAKTIKTIERLVTSRFDVTYFFHADDECTLTSSGELWVHPNSAPVTGSIFVMPEIRGVSIEEMKNCSGLCTDYVIQYYDEYNSLGILKNERHKN